MFVSGCVLCWNPWKASAQSSSQPSVEFSASSLIMLKFFKLDNIRRNSSTPFLVIHYTLLLFRKEKFAVVMLHLYHVDSLLSLSSSNLSHRRDFFLNWFVLSNNKWLYICPLVHMSMLSRRNLILCWRKEEGEEEEKANRLLSACQFLFFFFVFPAAAASSAAYSHLSVSWGLTGFGGWGGIGRMLKITLLC